MSMILGEVGATAATMLITKHLAPGAELRVTTVGRLRRSGFMVVHFTEDVSTRGRKR
jgi:hypothetical protein